MHHLIRLFAGSAMLAIGFAANAADCANGQQVFQTKCSACHALDADHVGPHLQGVVGRPIGSVKGYTYSSDLAGAKDTWSLEQLDHWLTAPAKMFPETSMAFGGLRKAEERQAVICYLQNHG
ncbi:Cytochrome c-552 [compost metagenome]